MRYKRRDDWHDRADVLQVVKEFNEKFFIVQHFGGKCLVCWQELSSYFTNGKHYDLHHMEFRDFSNGHHLLFRLGGTDKHPDCISHGDAWLEHPARRQYEEIQFAPERQLPPNIYNLWRGFAYEPRQGDCSLYLAHVRENICANDPVKYNYLIRWMAYTVRHPDEVGQVAIVIQGLKGTGKSFFAQKFSDLFGSHGITVGSESRVTGNFNAHLRDKVVLVAEEAFFAGDKRHEGILKDMVTGETLTIEPKFVDVTTVSNLLHMIIISNEQWVVPTSWDERRYLVMRCGAARKNKTDYFEAINQQMRQGGYEALLWHLKNEVDLSDFDVRIAPHTKELDEQSTFTLKGVEKYWYDCLETGELPGRVLKLGTAYLRSENFLAWAGRRDHGKSYGLTATRLGLLLHDDDAMGFQKDRVENRHVFLIPELNAARSRWDTKRQKGAWHQRQDWETESWLEC